MNSDKLPVNGVEPRYDVTGRLIKLHDVLIETETKEMRLVVYGSNSSGICGLAAVNDVVGAKDWLDVYPDKTFKIVGNAETVSEWEGN